MFPSRDSLIDAYFDHLVGYQREDGKKVYLPFDPSRSINVTPSVRSEEYQGVRVVQYQRVFPALDQATSTPPPDALFPDSPHDVAYDYEPARNQGRLADADIESSRYAIGGGETYNLNGDVYAINPPSGAPYYSFDIPAGAEKRFGNPFEAFGWEKIWGCSGFTQYDCDQCCDDYTNTALLTTTALTTASVACFWTLFAIPVCVLGLVVGLGATATVWRLPDLCHENCRLIYYQG